MSESLSKPDHIQPFASFNKFWATHRTQHGEQTLLWESRRTIDEKQILYTVFDKDEVRVSSINDFLFAYPKCLSLSIKHNVNVLWNGELKHATLSEIFSLQSEPLRCVLKLCLAIGDTRYETEYCDSLTDAIWDLDEIINDNVTWWLQTCYDCIYSRPAYLFPVSDRDEMRCYRDVPDAFEEVKNQGKFASNSALHAGHYFVDAFHSCAAWKPPAPGDSS